MLAAETHKNAKNCGILNSEAEFWTPVCVCAGVRLALIGNQLCVTLMQVP